MKPSFLLFFLLMAQAEPTPAQTARVDSIQSEKNYFSLVSTLQGPSFQREIEYPFFLILDDSQKSYFDSLQTLAAKKAFIISYWRQNDPNPLLPENEWLLEFIRRQNYVRLHFAQTQPPFFDARGGYYLKFGAPQFRFIDAGGAKTLDPFTYRTLLNFYKAPPAERYSVLPNESWGYEDIHEGLFVHFVQIDSAYQEIESLSEILNTTKTNERFWYWHSLIKERAAISPQVYKIFLKNESYLEQLDLIAHGASPNLYDDTQLGGPFQPHTFISEQKDRLALAAQHTRYQLPDAAFQPHKAVSRFEFTDDVAQFRAENGKTRLAVSIRSAFQNNLVHGSSAASDDTLHLQFRCRLRNVFSDSLTESQWQTTLPLMSAAAENLPNFLASINLLVAPTEGELILQIKDLKNHKIGFYKKSIDVRDFNQPHLMLSDLQLFTEASTPSLQQILPVTEILSLKLAPYPLSHIEPAWPVFCYFEIYNIRNAGIKNAFEIQLTISRLPVRENILSKVSNLFARSVDEILSIKNVQAVSENTAREIMNIDFSKIAAGSYLLEITVRDTENENLTARGQKVIEVTN
ncbi:MAG: GWxTD domain-containing protein [bacterium]